jgi:DNA-binding NtrC family response regulator
MMRVLLGCTDKEKLGEFKKTLEADGHEVLAVSSKQSWENLIKAGYVTNIDVVISQYWLSSFYGHALVAKVGFYTPALIWDARRSFKNTVLKYKCFPNLTFTAEVMEVEKIAHCANELQSMLTQEKV